MNISDDLNLPLLGEILLLANTPNYVYKNFRRQETVRQLATKYSAEQLIQEYHSRLSRADRLNDDLIVAYAVLVGLTFLDYSKAIDAINKLDMSLIIWGHEIKNIFVATAKVVNVVDISYQPLKNSSIVTSAPESTQTQIIVINIDQKG